MIVSCLLAVICALVVHGSVIHTNDIRLVSNRIVGGSIAKDGGYPYQASLRAGGAHFCGGSVLNNRWILTAAHCTVGESPSSFSIVVGTNSIVDIGAEYSVEKVIVHEEYDGGLIINDVSVVRVSKDIEFNSRVQPIRLPVAPTKAGSNLTLTGWGRTSYPGSLPSMLQVITLTYLRWQSCRDRFVGVNAVYSSQICSLTKTGEGACHGDSGGPLVQGGQVVGIVSWGMPCARGYPDVYSSVYYFKEWILNQINASNDVF